MSLRDALLSEAATASRSGQMQRLEELSHQARDLEAELHDCRQQLEEARRENRNAVRTLAVVVRTAGGLVEVPRRYWLEDGTIMRGKDLVNNTDVFTYWPPKRSSP